MNLPKTPRDLFKLSVRDRLLYGVVEWVARLTGRWRRPMRAFGDFERMRFIDKVYWLHKTTNPIMRPERSAAVQALAANRMEAPSLPDGFIVSERRTIAAVGDLINHPYLGNSERTLYADVADVIFDADVTTANLECPITTDDADEFSFAADAPPVLFYNRREFDIVRAHGQRQFVFLSTACNHSLDFGPDGVDATIEALQACGVAFHGTNAREADADVPAIIRRGRLALGMFAITFGLNGKMPPADRPRIVNRMLLNDGVGANDFAQVSLWIRRIRDAGANFIVAHLHWGMEHEMFPTARQVELGHHLSEMGVDLIIGHHPHVVQPLEMYRTRRDPARVVPIYYSLGNLVNYFSAPYLRRSAVARLRLGVGTGAEGREAVYVERASTMVVEQVADDATRTLRLQLV